MRHVGFQVSDGRTGGDFDDDKQESFQGTQREGKTKKTRTTCVCI